MRAYMIERGILNHLKLMLDTILLKRLHNIL